MNRLSSLPPSLDAMRRYLDEVRSFRHNRCAACLEQEGEIRATAAGKFLQISANQQSKKHGGRDG